jgi:hypothetical protein
MVRTSYNLALNELKQIPFLDVPDSIVEANVYR